MLELTQAFDAYVNGGTLPDGTLPTYSDDLPGNPSTGYAQTVATPTGDLGFGVDLACWDDFTPDFQLVDPKSTVAVLMSNYRRLNTPLGFLDLINEPSDFGKDVRGLLQKGITPDEIKRHEDEIRAQILEDDRNLTCECTLTMEGLGSLKIELSGRTSFGPYALIMALTNGELLIRAMNTEDRPDA